MRKLLAGIALMIAGPAFADPMTATRPSLICTSPEALARLVVSGGRSRIGTSAEAPGDRQLMASGGCIEVPTGTRVEAQVTRTNTSIATYDAQDGRGPRTFVVPNVNFALGSASALATPGQRRIGAPNSLDAFWQHVDQICPQRRWRTATDGSVFEAVMEQINIPLTPAQQKKVKDDSRSCEGMFSGCRSNMYIANMMRFGKAEQLAQGMCTIEPDHTDSSR